jgi:hypothetical protein
VLAKRYASAGAGATQNREDGPWPFDGRARNAGGL